MPHKAGTWPQTWWQARKIMPLLPDRYRVIAVDLRGMVGSDAPAAGYDKNASVLTARGDPRPPAAGTGPSART